MNILWFGPYGFDYLSNQVQEGMHLLSKQGVLELKCTEKVVHHGSKTADLETISGEEAMDNIDWADMIIFASGGDMGFLSGWTGKMLEEEKARKKLVFLDGHDSDTILTSPEDLVVYFKRELRFPFASAVLHRRIRGLTFGVYQFLVDEFERRFANKSLDDQWYERDIDVAYMVYGGSNKARKDAAEILNRICERCPEFKMEIHIADDGQPVGQKDYHDIMYRSKIGVSIEGAGFDTLRFWETPAHGCILSAHDFDRSFCCRNLPEPSRHMLSWDNWQRFAEFTYVACKEKERWISMRKAMDPFLFSHHTTVHRAKEVIEIFNELV